MNIRSSLEWEDLRTSLRRTINYTTHTHTNKSQLYKIIDNISDEVSLLSKAEVLARRGNKAKAIYLLEKINKDITELREFMLVAALIG